MKAQIGMEKDRIPGRVDLIILSIEVALPF